MVLPEARADARVPGFRETELGRRDVMSHGERCCPQCGSQELDEDHLSERGSAWPILFGGRLGAKRDLVAYACRDCGFVFLYLGPTAKASTKVD